MDDDDDISDLISERPRTRDDCNGGPRPCPWVGCRHHLYLDVHPITGSIKTVDGEPWDMKHTCALDVADLGGITLEETAREFGVTRERIRQIESKALIRLRPSVRKFR